MPPVWTSVGQQWHSELWLNKKNGWASASRDTISAKEGKYFSGLSLLLR